MANTITLVSAVRDRQQFQGLWSEMWKIRATIDDQDAIALNDAAQFDLTVTGLALGDIPLFYSLSIAIEEGGDALVDSVYVSAANVLTLNFQADLSEFAADTLNGAVFRAVVGRPNW